MAGNAARNGKPVARLYRPASPKQLWRLNEQKLLQPVPPDAFHPGAFPENEPITSAEADALLRRCLEERWPGLARWPRAGEAWRVEGGLVVPIGTEGES